MPDQTTVGLVHRFKKINNSVKLSSLMNYSRRLKKQWDVPLFVEIRYVKGYSELWSDNDMYTFRSLTKCHTKRWRV